MKKILLATDGSSHAEDAARFLSHLPHEEQIELDVLTVLETPSVNFHYPTTDWIQGVMERERAEAVETFQKVEALFDGANVNLKHVIREGIRQTTIVDVAKEIKAHLVVVGAKGHSTVSRILLGSVSDYVATHAHCSVLVVRPTKTPMTGRPLRIAIGYEDAGPATAALEEFSDFGWGAETDVRVVSVVSYLAGIFLRTALETSATKTAALKAAKEAAQSIKDIAPSATAMVVESEHEGEGLVAFAEEHDTDLLFVGATARSKLGRILLGSVSKFVLRYASCSVWITRNRFVRGNKSPKSDQKAKVGLQ